MSRASSSSRARRLLLWCAATDRSFERAELGGAGGWPARRTLGGPPPTTGPEGGRRPRAPAEHIVPRNHGGTDALDNLAIACARCNFGKGHRLDVRRLDDPTLQRVVAMLQARRAERMRPPLPGLDLPPLRGGSDDEDDE